MLSKRYESTEVDRRTWLILFALDGTLIYRDLISTFDLYNDKIDLFIHFFSRIMTSCFAFPFHQCMMIICTRFTITENFDLCGPEITIFSAYIIIEPSLHCVLKEVPNCGRYHIINYT